MHAYIHKYTRILLSFLKGLFKDNTYHTYLIFNHVPHHFSINPTTVMVGGSEIRVQLVHFVMIEWKSYFTLRIKNLIFFLQF